MQGRTLRRNQGWHRSQQPLRIAVLRAVEHIFYRPLLHHDALFHYGDTIGDIRHHAEIVRDEQHRHAAPLLDVADQLEDLRLGGHVECGCRLVRDQDRRL